jgi:hypothetical protein
MKQNCRNRLGDPKPGKPSDRRLFQAVAEQTQNFLNRISLTGQPWAVDEYLLTVTPNTTDYLLSVDSGFGKPLQVLTYYPANLSIPQRYVDFFLISDLNYNWGLPVNVASWTYNDGSPCTAQRIAFFRKSDDSIWVRVLPMPQLSAQYQITFELGNWIDSAGLEQSTVLSQFHNLPEIWACQSVLPQCRWSDDVKADRDQRKDLAASLAADESRVRDTFETYIRSMTMDHLSTRNSSFDDSAWGWS